MTVIETPAPTTPASHAPAVIDPVVAAREAEARQKRITSAQLYLDGVHVSFDGFHAINNLSMVLAPGEMRAIIGPNGAGKTTMMDIITGKTMTRVREADGLQHLVDPLGLGAAAAPEQRAAHGVIDIQRQQQIVVNRLALEHCRLLEFTADAELGDLGFVQQREIMGAVKIDVALVRLSLAGDNVHHRGLASAVRADDGTHLAGCQHHRQVVDLSLIHI